MSVELKPRWYQREAKEAIYDHLRQGSGDPCAVLPTGAGKTICIADICRDVVKWGDRVCVLAHVKELLMQAAEKLAYFLPAGTVARPTVGIYSAGLERKDTSNPCIVAGIKSAYTHASDFCLCSKPFSIIIVDEAHLIPPKDAGMYRQFLGEMKKLNPKLVIIGLTATPYRLSTGLIYGGKDDIFSACCYEAPIKQLIHEGYLCPLKARAGKIHANMTDVEIKRGEFVTAQMVEAFDGVMLSAVEEILLLSQSCKSVLTFAPDVKYAQQVCELYRVAGESAEYITGKTPKRERERILLDYKNQVFKHLVNVRVLTTGFDAPNIDCVALLCATASPGLYYQMIGRGLRIHPDKKFCLVLDYGENVERHGPIDMIKPPIKKGESKGEAVTKVCPYCQLILFAGYAVCPDCGYEFSAEQIAHAERAGNKEVISGEVTLFEVEVAYVDYYVHYKRGFENDHCVPPTMRVEYKTAGIPGETYKEYLGFEHDNYALEKACDWWYSRCKYVPVPETVKGAVEFAKAGGLPRTTKIMVRYTAGEKFPEEVIGWEHEPPLSEESVEEIYAALDAQGITLSQEAGAEVAASENPDSWFGEVDTDEMLFQL